MHQFLADWRNLLWLVGLAGGAILVALVSHAIIYAIGKRIANRKDGKFYQLLVTRQERPTRLLLPLLALTGVIPWLPLSQVILSRLNHLSMVASKAARVVSAAAEGGQPRPVIEFGQRRTHDPAQDTGHGPDVHGGRIGTDRRASSRCRIPLGSNRRSFSSRTAPASAWRFPRIFPLWLRARSMKN